MQVCPTDAIIMMKSFDMAHGGSPRDAARQGPPARDRPAARGRRGRTGNQLRDMQAPPKKAAAEHAEAVKPAAAPAEAMTLMPSRSRFWALRHRPRRRRRSRSSSARTSFTPVLWLALALVGDRAASSCTLDAEFLAAVQVLLYAGGVITVVVFAIVVTERLVGERLSQTSRRIGGGGAGVGRRSSRCIVRAIRRRRMRHAAAAAWPAT